MRFGDCQGLPYDRAESRFVGDVMIGRQDGHDGIRVAGGKRYRRQAYGGGSVAADRLGQDVAFGEAGDHRRNGVL